MDTSQITHDGLLYNSLLTHCRKRIKSAQGVRLSRHALEDCCIDSVHDTLLQYRKPSCNISITNLPAYVDRVFSNKVKGLLALSYHEDTLSLGDLEEESHWTPYIDTSFTDYKIYLLSATQTLMELCEQVCRNNLPSYVDLNGVYMPIICQALGNPYPLFIRDKRTKIAVKLCINILKHRIHEEMPYHD